MHLLRRKGSAVLAAAGLLGVDLIRSPRGDGVLL